MTEEGGCRTATNEDLPYRGREEKQEAATEAPRSLAAMMQEWLLGMMPYNTFGVRLQAPEEPHPSAYRQSYCTQGRPVKGGGPQRHSATVLFNITISPPKRMNFLSFATPDGPGHLPLASSFCLQGACQWLITSNRKKCPQQPGETRP